MLYCSERRFLRASMYFMGATMYRSNGVMLAGFIIWGMLVESFVKKAVERRHEWMSLNTVEVVKCVGVSTLPFVPFVWHQYEGYKAFCSGVELRSWCGNGIPRIYTFVQSEYWNVGFLRYWTISQMPNFALAAPVLGLLLFCAVRELLRTHKLIVTAQSRSRSSLGTPLAVLPHAIHALLLALILIFAAHTQIALRFAAALPFTYWSAASLFIDTTPPSLRHSGGIKGAGNRRSIAATCWVWWSALWGSISLTTWATFLPPA